MSLLALNYDVLSLVLHMVSPRDASQLALASHHAYDIAMPRFLSEATLGGVFYKPQCSATRQLTQFCEFMLANVPERLVHLQRLQIMRDAVRRRVNGSWVVDTACVTLLTALLARAVHLQKVTIWGMDALFSAHPPIADALAGLPYLRSACLGGDVPALPTLAHALPRVTALQFIEGGGSCGLDWGEQTSADAWPRLDRIDTGHPILPLACAVRRVDLRNPLHPDAFLLANAHDFIARTRPVVLSCALDASLTDTDFAEYVVRAAKHAKFLEVVLHRCDSMSGVIAWMTRIARVLGPLPLHGLSLCRSGSLPPAHDLPAANTNALHAVARVVMEAVPSLRYVGLQPHGETTYNCFGPSWYRASSLSSGKAHDVELLSRAEGTAVQRVLQGLDIYD
ncbi:hypothetical protein B0H21DRAFT_572493 [Amylocystis lapponica]|nr:hypothetical protein B0H21DRAFT_572493 [Amylocystis lapponica]